MANTYIIIGNGFDLECGLPTKYTDYLGFLDAVRENYRTGNKAPLKGLEFLSHKARSILCGDGFDSSPWKPAFDNYWFNHFFSRSFKTGWVDFEKEISRIVNVSERCMGNMYDHPSSLEDIINVETHVDFKHKLEDIVYTEDLIRDINDTELSYSPEMLTWRHYRDCLLNSLNDFTLGFENYLSLFVENEEPRITDSIKTLLTIIGKNDNTRIISFNYTKTLETILEVNGLMNKCELCYIHGKASDDMAKNSVVLGIDDALPSNDDMQDVTAFAAFRKYYQRIYKNTDSQYLNWIKELSEKKLDSKRFLYIFGHSLCLPDKNIVMPFIQARGMITTVYYYNQDAFSEQLSNLLAVLDPPEIDKMISGPDRSIMFVDQNMKS